MRIFFTGIIVVLLCVQCDYTSSQKNVDSLYDEDVFSTSIPIGFAEKFDNQETDEIYIELNTKVPITTYEVYDSISKLATKEIYQDNEYRRMAYQEEDASNCFNLQALDEIAVFNEDARCVGNAVLKRVEFLDKNISPSFIAVYEGLGKDYDARFYIGSQNVQTDALSVQKMKSNNKLVIDDQLNEAEKSTKYINQTDDYLINDSLHLIIANRDNFSFIFHDKQDQLSRLYKSNKYEIFRRVQFVPLFANGYPIMLCEFFLSESDMRWSDVLYFNGEQYQPAENNRIDSSIFE